MPDPIIAFAVAEILGHGRQIEGHDERLKFYRGVLRLADQASELEAVRQVILQMKDCDEQLILLEQEQRKLALSSGNQK